MLEQPLSYKVIQQKTCVAKSTANDIYHHALKNATGKREMKQELEKQKERESRIQPRFNSEHFLAGIDAELAQSYSEGDEDGEFSEDGEVLSLLDLIAAECLDPDARSGRPDVPSEGVKDRLVATVKRNITTWRMRIVDIKREAGLGHVSDSTILKVSNEWGIKPYWEEFKFILKPGNKVQRLVSEAKIHIIGQLHL
jgi:hypothetical protein